MSRRSRRSRRGGGGGPFSLFSFQDIMAAVTGVMIVTTLLLVIDLLTRTVSASPSESAPPTAELDAQLEGKRARRDELNARLSARTPSEAPAAVVASSQIDFLGDRIERLRAEREQLEAAWVEIDAALQALASRGERLDEQTQRLAQEVADVRRRSAAALNRQQVTRLGGDASGKRTWWVRVGAGSTTAGSLQAPDGDSLGDTVELKNTHAVLDWSAELDPQADAVVLLVEPGGVEAFTTLQNALRARGLDVGWDLVLESPRSTTP